MNLERTCRAGRERPPWGGASIAYQTGCMPGRVCLENPVPENQIETGLEREPQALLGIPARLRLKCMVLSKGKSKGAQKGDSTLLSI